MPGGQLSRERGGGGGGRGSQQGIKRKGYEEKVSGGAGSPPHPPAWLDVAQGMLSAGFKLQEAEPFPSSRAWGGCSGSLQVWNSSLAALGQGFPARPEAVRSLMRVAGCPACLPAAMAAEIHPACSPFHVFFLLYTQ